MNSFHPNNPFLFVLAGGVILFVLAQSCYFLVKAWKRARQLGISPGTLKRITLSSASFTVAPALSILLGVITLSKLLGLPLPWLRLSVVGALTYELPAASTAAAAMGASISEQATDPRVYTSIAWVMTLGIIPGVFYLPFLLRKIQRGIVHLKRKDEQWGEIFMSALFLGMISAFLGVIFADVKSGLAGWIPVFVMGVSLLLMLLCGLLIQRLRWKWLEDFALPICMIGAMAAAIPIQQLILG